MGSGVWDDVVSQSPHTLLSLQPARSDSPDKPQIPSESTPSSPKKAASVASSPERRQQTPKTSETPPPSSPQKQHNLPLSPEKSNLPIPPVIDVIIETPIFDDPLRISPTTAAPAFSAYNSLTAAQKFQELDLESSPLAFSDNTPRSDSPPPKKYIKPEISDHVQ
jgi:hypothetical protein